MKRYYLIGLIVLCSIVGIWLIKKQHQRVALADDPLYHFAFAYKDRIKKVVLSNGMTVLVCRTPGMGSVMVQVLYDVGARDESRGEKGYAHLIEHMIVKGTTKLSESDIPAIVRRYGARHNAATYIDSTCFHYQLPKINWQQVLPVIADSMQNARFDAQHLASEVKTVSRQHFT